MAVRSRIGFSREFELRGVSRLVAPGDVVLDIGANVGSYTYRFAKQVGPTGRVVCFEPQPELAAYLRAACRGRRLAPVEIHNVGLSDHAGEGWLSVPVEGRHRVGGLASLEPRTDQDGFEVSLRRLDDFDLGDRVSFVKCDVEGHELAVLRGGRATLERYRPTLQIEIEYKHVGERILDTFAFMDELGYRPHFLDLRAAVQPVPTEVLGHADRLNHPTDERYVGNFLFLPSG